ncbi:RNA methyltransferase tRNA(m5U54)methyltransferase [Lecanicillium sp. MT-2017a]|nr:RNA methyltransferase tRNA(m5U54)methyltransferase [Lecanicillium sp. MT-2017a]
MTGTPPATETVDVDGKQFRTVTEGRAKILVPHGAKIGEDRGEVQQVFYNPIQQYNRDLSVLAIKTYGEDVMEKKAKSLKEAKRGKNGKKRKRGDENGTGTEASSTVEPKPAAEAEATPELSQTPSFKILDALSASGLRALRYAREIPFVTSVTANDLSNSASKSIKQNVDYNEVQDKVSVTNEDALALMYRAIADDLSSPRDRSGKPKKTNKFDVIDLDPYGTAAPFFDAAIQSVRDDGGLLCVTCTDSAVWAGHSYSEKTFALYGGTPIHGMHSHEAGLRLILNAIATSGARYGLTIEPLLSLSIDFYTKVFVKVVKSPQAVKFLGAKTILVYSCDSGCGAWETQHLMRSKAVPNKKATGAFYKHIIAQGPTADRMCQHCGQKMHINGPMYGGHIHSRDFVEKLLKQIPNSPSEVYGTLPRLEGMLQNVLEEIIPGPEETEPVDARDAEYAKIDPYPFYIIPGKLGSVVSCTTPGDDMFKGALKHLGYIAGRSHCRPGSIKTDAPWSTIWWIMTEWIKQKAPVKVSKFKPSMAAWKILKDAGIIGTEENGAEVELPKEELKSATDQEMEDVEIKVDAAKDAPADNNEQPASEEELRKTLVFNEALARLGRQDTPRKFVRYQSNPRKNWGPLTKAMSN